MKNRIRECRKAAGMGQAELGNQVGFADNTISNYEKACVNPHWKYGNALLPLCTSALLT